VLTDAISITVGESLDPPQQALARVLLAELTGDWGSAAATAARSRVDFPRLFDLAARESFAHLCAGTVDKARDALDRFPRLEVDAGNPIAWLQAFIALQAGDLPLARKRLTLFLGEAVSGDTESLRARLLAAWDESPDSDNTQTVAYYFPHLPPVFTGLAETITRRQYGPSALNRAAGYHFSVSQETSPMQDQDSRPLCILAVCTEWFSRHGGVPTFNRDLCIALHRAGQRVVCLVAGKDADEDKHARENGIILIEARRVTGMDEKSRLYLRAPMPDGFVPDVVIGHDHVTGTAAKVQQDDHFPRARRVHFIHTAPGDIEWFKSQQGTTAAEKAERKELGQQELAETAQLIVAVGPRLHAEIGTLLHGLVNCAPLHRLDPGIGCLQAEREPPLLAQCLLLGRTEDAELKGLDIAARAIGLMGAGRPRLIVRGAEPGKGDALRKQLLDWATSPGIEIRTREYVAGAKRLAQDLRTSSLLLMPSRSEGFGLVGAEALAAGTPILITSKSGLAELISEHCPSEVANRCIVPVIDNREIDANAWERQIAYVMRDRRAAFRNTAEMAALLSRELTWDRAAGGLLDALNKVR